MQEYSILTGVAQRQRRHSCFGLDALVVVKIDVAVNDLVGNPSHLVCPFSLAVHSV